MTPRTTDPIFVVGYMHSGTTMILNLLSNHPDVFTPRTETKFFMHMGIVHKLLGPIRSDQDLRQATAFCRYVIERGFPIGTEGSPWRSYSEFDAPDGVRAPIRHGELLRAVLDAYTAQAGKIRWVEKTPTHVFNVDEILDVIPDARFVEIVRDCRDVLASKKTRRAEVWTDRNPPEKQYRRHLEKAYDPVWDTLSWRAAVRAGHRASVTWPQRWLRVRYEDVVAEPEELAARICGFAQLRFSPDLLDVTRGNPADMRATREGRGVSASSVDRWQTTLTLEEAGVSERIARHELSLLGYPLDDGGASTPRLLTYVARRSVPELVLRMSRRFRLGGARYARDVLKGYAHRLRALVGSRGSSR
ncbi:MAG TPA: sulfotransferase [Actinomycetota bacterium]|jgi:hypothetical protein|nr:sulfotransferase [Actinomycetota bacterium]